MDFNIYLKDEGKKFRDYLTHFCNVLEVNLYEMQKVSDGKIRDMAKMTWDMKQNCENDGRKFDPEIQMKTTAYAILCQKPLQFTSSSYTDDRRRYNINTHFAFFMIATPLFGELSKTFSEMSTDRYHKNILSAVLGENYERRFILPLDKCGSDKKDTINEINRISTALNSKKTKEIADAAIRRLI